MDLLPDSSKLTNSGERVDTWISIGRFDAIQTYQLKLGEQNIFEAIQENSEQVWDCCNADVYAHALVLISAESPSSEKPFWDSQSWFLSVSRIHFRDSAASTDTFQGIAASIDSEAKKLGVSHRVYRTEALSDMVLVCKTNRFDQILKLTLSLQQLPEVGKIYTHFGVNYDFLKIYSQDAAHSVPLIQENDQIPFFSMRFAIEDFSGVDDQIRKLEEILGQKEVYAVAGVDDIIITWENTCVSKLIQLYCSWFLPDSSLPRRFQGDVFQDITTRLGIPYEPLDIPPLGPVQNVDLLQEKCRYLLSLSSKIKRQPNSEEWIRPLTELTRTMKRISQTAVLDEFVYIMIPAVEAFLRNIVVYQNDLHQANIEMCNRFVENWTQLMEHVMRVEDQLAHHPDTRPVLFNFSVAMLEYTLAFLDLVTNLLQSTDCDGSTDRKIRMLLVPRLCSRIEAQELFAADQSGKLPGLVLVTIPVSDLYKPHEVQRALCHEVSHFIGEKNRCRKERTMFYFQAVAVLIAKVIYRSYDPNTIKTIFGDLYVDFGLSKKRNTIQNMQELVLSKLNELLPDIGAASNNKSMDFCSLNQFSCLLEDVSILFREVYADICMLFILPQSETQEHIKNLFTELVNGESNDHRRRYEQFAIRIYVSLKALKRDTALGDARSLLYPEDVADKLYAELEKLRLAGSEESTTRLIPFSTIKRLQKYADACVESLRANLKEGKNSKDLERIRSMFLEVASPELDYENFLQYISTYREKILISDGNGEN